MVGVAYQVGVAQQHRAVLMAAFVVNTLRVFGVSSCVWRLNRGRALIGLLGGMVVHAHQPVFREIYVIPKNAIVMSAGAGYNAINNEKWRAPIWFGEAIKDLFGMRLNTGLITEVDAIYARNQIGRGPGWMNTRSRKGKVLRDLEAI